MNVVGITGLAGSGKSTVAEYLVREHGFTRLSFAGPLKAMLRTLDPILGAKVILDGESMTYEAAPIRLSHLDKRGWSEQEIKESRYGGEYRRLLQKLGTDCIRAHRPDFWVDAATAQMTDEDGKYVFDDVRFQNEAEVIKSINPWGLWHVARPELTLAPDAHVSEHNAGHMGEVQILANVTTKEFLYSEVDRALRLAFSDTALLAEEAA